MEADLTRRQQLAWCFGALGVPAMLLCASAAWQWVLVAGACAALYYIIVWRLWVRAGQKPLPGLACEAFGVPVADLPRIRRWSAALAGNGDPEAMLPDAAGFIYEQMKRMVVSFVRVMSA